MKFNVKIIGIILGFLILVLAISIFLIPQDQSQQTPVEISPTTAKIPVQTDKGTRWNSYEEFISSGKSEICVFSTQVDDTYTTGTIYAANGKIKTDFTVAIPKGTFQQHVLVDSFMLYMWSNLNNKGVKFEVKSKQDAGGLKSVFNETPYNFNCDEWKADNSVFELPANIVFTEITENTIDNIEKLKQDNPSAFSNTTQCNVCNTLSDESAKNSCRVQYNCK